jgi:hypothetical protein
MTDPFQEHHLIRRLWIQRLILANIPHDRTANSIFKQKNTPLFVAYEKAFAGSEKIWIWPHQFATLVCIHYRHKGFFNECKSGNNGDNISFVDYKHFNRNKHTLDKQIGTWMCLIYCLLFE